MTPSALTTGDIVLVAFPFTDLSGSKVRPALIIGWARPPDVVLAFITSASATLSPADVLLVPGDPEFSATGLRLPSRLRADRLATLETALVLRRLGVAGPKTMESVRDALRFVFGL